MFIFLICQYNFKYTKLMNKAELIDQIASKADISKQTASLALDSFIDRLKENLNKGAEVRIVGLGT